MCTMGAVRVLVVDDSAAFHEAAENLLGLDDRIDVVGTAWSAEQANDILDRVKVDLVLLDVNLPDANGVDLATEIDKRFPQVLVVLCSTMTRDEAEVPTAPDAPIFVEKYQLSSTMLLELWQTKQ
jgi:DNA-binding NarL/FixJ family response regulator